MIGSPARRPSSSATANSDDPPTDSIASVTCFNKPPRPRKLGSFALTIGKPSAKADSESKSSRRANPSRSPSRMLAASSCTKSVQSPPKVCSTSVLTWPSNPASETRIVPPNSLVATDDRIGNSSSIRPSSEARAEMLFDWLSSDRNRSARLTRSSVMPVAGSTRSTATETKLGWPAESTNRPPSTSTARNPRFPCAWKLLPENSTLPMAIGASPTLSMNR